MLNTTVRSGDDEELESFLAQRIAEYNATASGHHDAESVSASYRSDSGNIEAGISGYTWGGCCYVSYLWVSQALRGRGIGSELLRSLESHAHQRRCGWVFLSSHSFQAPEFYVRRGYVELGRINNHPLGHANILLGKRLAAQ